MTSKPSALHAASTWVQIGPPRYRPRLADVWGWFFLTCWVCKSFSPEQSTKGQWQQPTHFCSQNIYFCTQLLAQGIPLVATGTTCLAKFLLCFFTLNWILGFGMAGFILLLVSLESGLITLLEAVSIFSKNQQAASTGRICSELTTRKM